MPKSVLFASRLLSLPTRRVASLAFTFALAFTGGCPTSHSHESDAHVDPDASGDAALPDAVTDAATDTDAGPDAGPIPEPARVLVLANDGHAASIDAASPFTLRASANLGADVSSAQCRGFHCLVVHPAPTDTVDLVDARNLAVLDTFTFDVDSDLRDAVWVDATTVVVTQYGSADVVLLDPTTGDMTPISLSALADADGLPESGMASACGRRVYVQVARLDHKTGVLDALGGAIAVIDLDLPAAERVLDVEPDTAGVQGIALPIRAAFDMPVDCAGDVLYVAEPKPLFSGGGIYQAVDLATLVAGDYPLASSAEVGGFEVIDDVLAWRITHTDFGPGASSHLELVGAGPYDAYNTFSGQHVDDLALDRVGDMLFFPDPCLITPSNQACTGGVHPFHAHSGLPATAAGIGIDVGFEPTEIAIARP